MEVKKIVKKKERKALTLHKHYLIDIRRFKKELNLDSSSFGRELETKIISRDKKRYLAIRVI